MTWQDTLSFFQNDTHQQLLAQVAELRKAASIYPPQEQILRVYEACPLHQVKVVILGQDPYHGAGQAHGFAFSVAQDCKIPPSLRNIFKELQSDLGIKRTNTNLEDWVAQGVFLLNSTLTVEEGKPASHQKLGWETLTDETIVAINAHLSGVVFILWGAHAIKKKALIDAQKHCIIESVHPSPLSASRGFFGSKPFSQCNTYLESSGKTPIHWGE